MRLKCIFPKSVKSNPETDFFNLEYVFFADLSRGVGRIALKCRFYIRKQGFLTPLYMTYFRLKIDFQPKWPDFSIFQTKNSASARKNTSICIKPKFFQLNFENLKISIFLRFFSEKIEIFNFFLKLLEKFWFYTYRRIFTS